MRSQFCVHKDPLGSTGKEGRQNFVFTVTHFHHSKKLILIIRLLKTTFAFSLMSKVDCDRHQYRLYPTVQSVQLCWCASAWPVLLGRCSSNVRFCGKKGNRYCGLNELKDLVLSLGQRTQCVVPLVKRYCASVRVQMDSVSRKCSKRELIPVRVLQCTNFILQYSRLLVLASRWGIAAYVVKVLGPATPDPKKSLILRCFYTDCSW